MRADSSVLNILLVLIAAKKRQLICKPRGGVVLNGWQHPAVLNTAATTTHTRCHKPLVERRESKLYSKHGSYSRMHIALADIHRPHAGSLLSLVSLHTCQFAQQAGLSRRRVIS